MQHDTRKQYETQDQHQHTPLPDEAEHKLGSAQPDTDPLDAVGGPGPVGIPPEYVAAERRPVALMPVEALPIETQPTDFMTPDGRPRDVRPREFLPVEGR